MFLVSYDFDGGSGRCEVAPKYGYPNSLAAVERMEAAIEKSNGTTGVTITNFIRFRRWWEFWK